VAVSAAEIKTVYNSSFIYPIIMAAKRVWHGGRAIQKKDTTTKDILSNINLHLVPGRQYLILGSPGSGKSTYVHFSLWLVEIYFANKQINISHLTHFFLCFRLLRAIAGLIKPKKKETLSGKIIYNGLSLQVSSFAACELGRQASFL
jgi:hypothetical protein